MAGSFKSTVWDYYLPTDVHEASEICKYFAPGSYRCGAEKVPGHWNEPHYNELDIL